jgi:uncharacterized protein (DUF433 family)
VNRSQRLTSSPGVCHGNVCIKGTRVTVASILGDLAAGESIEAILADRPELSHDDVRAAADYGAEVARYRSIASARRRE